MANCTHYRNLLAGLLDNELTPEEPRELNDHLIRCASCRSEYEELSRTQDKLKLVSFVEPTDEAAMNLWKLPYSRAARNAGLVMIIGGYLILLALGLVAFLTDDSEGFWLRLAGGGIILGFFILLGLLGIERLQTYQKDPYKEIER